jgi:trimeric autotransporter adhesin
VRFTVQPFGAAFTGGVRVAAADFNGDGIADLVVGTGTGIATQVKVLNGVGGGELFSVAPFEAAFTGGVFVAAGDINGDGKAELVISPDEGGGPRVQVYNGNAFAKLADFFGIDDPNFRGGARPAVGDINGDGKADLVVAAGFGGGPRVGVFSGASIGVGTPTKLFNDFFTFEQTLRNGTFVAVGDINADGKGDLISGGGPGGGPRVISLSGVDLLAGKADGSTRAINFFAGDVNARGGIRVTAKNLNNDANADLVVGDGTDAGSRVTGYSGAAFAGGGANPILNLTAFAGFNGGVFVG